MRSVLPVILTLIILLATSSIVAATLGTPSISPTNPPIDTGQSTILYSTWSGGTSPYNAVWYTGPSGNTCAEDSANQIAVYNGITSASNSIVVNPTTTNSYCIGVTDATPTTQLSSNDVITVNPDLGTPKLFPSSSSIDSGQSVTFTALWTGGSPTYSVSLYSSPTSTCNQQSTMVEQVTGLASSSATFSPVTPAANTYYCAFVTDNSTNAYSISRSFSLGNLLYGVAFSPDGSYAYVANCNSGNNEINGQTSCGGSGADNVLIINTATNSVVNSINSGFDGPAGIAFSPSGTYAYVTNMGSNTISIISTASNTVTGTISSGFSSPYGISFSPSGTYAYVANCGPSCGTTGNGNIVIINTATNSVTGSITAGFSASTGVAFSTSGTYAYVTNFNAYNAVIIDTATNTVVGVVTGSGLTNPDGVYFAPSGGYAYATSFWGNISIINTATNSIVGTIHSPFDNRGGVAISPTGAYAYMTNIYSDVLVIINTGVPTTKSVTSEITVNPVLSSPAISPSNPTIDSGQSVSFTASWSGGTPTYSASLYSSATSACTQQSTLIQQDIGLSATSVTFSPVTPAANTYYCAFVTDNAISAYSIVSAITSPFSYPSGVAFSPSGTYAYIANCNEACSGTIPTNIVIVSTSTNTVTGVINSGFNGQSYIAFSSSGTYAYVTNQYGGNVAIIDTATNSVVNSISASIKGPQGVAFSPSGTYAYITNSGSNNVVIINTATNTVTNAITSGFSSPQSVAFSPSGAYAYVENFNTNNIVVINTATNTVIGAITNIITYPGMAFSPTGEYAYINDNRNVAIVNAATNTIAGIITYGFNAPEGMAIAPSGTYAYVTNLNGNNAVIINTNIQIHDVTSEITVNPVLSSPAISPSNPTIDSGQSVSFTASWSGGTPDYTVKWYTGLTGNTCSQDSGNVLATYSSVTATSNSITVSPTSTNSYCIGVTDSASTPETQLSSNDVITVNNAITAGAIVPAGPIINPGQSVTLTANAVGGTSPYTYNWYSVAGASAPTCTTADQMAGQNTNSLVASPTAQATYSYEVIDSSTPNAIACSAGDTVTIHTGTQVSNPYAGGSTGFFGHLPGTITATSSITSTSTTITTIPTTPHSVTSSGAVEQICNDTSGYLINYPSLNVTFAIKPVTASCFSMTAAAAPADIPSLSNMSAIKAVNYTFSNRNISANLTMHYNCSIPASDMIPFILRNGTWQEITPFILDIAACTITFAAPSDPVIAVFESAPASKFNSTTTTTIAPVDTASTASAASQPQSGYAFQAVIAITVIIVFVALFVYFRNKNK